MTLVHNTMLTGLAPSSTLVSFPECGKEQMGMGFTEAIFQLESRDFHNDSNYSEALCVVQDYIREIIAREQRLKQRVEKLEKAVVIAVEGLCVIKTFDDGGGTRARQTLFMLESLKEN